MMPQFSKDTNKKFTQIVIDPLNSQFENSVYLGEKLKNIETFKPQGMLVNTLQEHQKPVNSIAVTDMVHGKNMLITASRDDKMIKMWDPRAIIDVSG